MSNAFETGVCRVWTDASYHPKADRVGRAAVFDTGNGTGLCAVVSSVASSDIHESAVEFSAVAAALRHLGHDTPVELTTDSTAAEWAINCIRSGRELPEGKKKRLLPEDIATVREHSDLVVHRHNRNEDDMIKLADQFANYKREGKIDSFVAQDYAKDHNIFAILDND